MNTNQIVMKAVKKALGASKAYTNEVVVGGGAIKGKNCVIDSITAITGGHRITFSWTLDNGTVQTDYIDVLDGVDGTDGDKGDTGLGIKSVAMDSNNHLIVTYDDNTTEDAGELTLNVSQIADVSFSNLQDGQILKYNATTGKWENSSGETVDTKLVDLNDVSVSNLQDGQTIVWDATNNRWVNGNSSAVADIEDLQDVEITTPADGDILIYDDTDGEWKNSNALSEKVDKVTGKGLSENDFTSTLKTKLDGIETGAQKNIIEEISVNGTSLTPDANKKVDIEVITKAVNDLVNYYLKSDTYSKSEVDSIVTAIKNSRFESVNTLPTTDIKTNVIYLVPKTTAQTDNVKDEYINLDGTTAGWEKIGDTEIDLSGYVTTSDLNTALADYVTSTNLTTILADYAQKTDLGIIANTYWTQIENLI